MELVDELTSLFIEIKIRVSENTQDPTREWKNLKTKCIKENVQKIDLDTPIKNDKIRIVCISDTHSKINSMSYPIPSKADILIHAGDITKFGTRRELLEFNTFLGNLKNIKHKIVIAGNHDIELKNNLAQKYLTNCIYLQDNSIEIYGLKIWGSPWQPIHCNNAFQLERGQELLEKWNLIPNNTDILITHGPPLGYGDRIGCVKHVGCVELLNTVKERVKPKYHIFGHIHEDYGIWTDNVTTFINASICNSFYKTVHEPILIDVDLPEGVHK